MTILQAQCFLEAAQSGSFTLASEKLYISQPTMSRQIRMLEEELQVSLFTRDHNTVKITSIGRELYPKIKSLYHNFMQSSVEIKELVNHRLSRLRIGILDSLNINDNIRTACLMVREKCPETMIQLCHLPLRQAYEALRDDTLDVLFMLNTSMRMPKGTQVRSLQFYRDRMCLAVPFDHPNAKLPYITNEEIRTYFGDMRFSLLAAEEFEPPLRTEKINSVVGYHENYVNKISGPFAGLDALMMLVSAGLGITCVNETGILQHNPKVKLIPLVDKTAEGIMEHEVFVNPYWMSYNDNDLLLYFLDCLEEIK